MVIACAWLLALLGFLGLAWRANNYGVLGLDLTLARWVQALPGFVGPVFDFENWLGDTAPLLLVTFVIALLLRRGWLEAALLLLTLVPRSLDVTVKDLVREPRPLPSQIDVHQAIGSFSFPSGHVIGVTLVFGLVAIVAPRLASDRRAVGLIRGVSLFLVATIGLARIWAGAHWPSDVLGGYLYATLFLLPALALLARRAQ